MLSNPGQTPGPDVALIEVDLGNGLSMPMTPNMGINLAVSYLIRTRCVRMHQLHAR